MGSSTADVIATIRAVADSCGLVWGPEIISSLAVRAEGASDPLAFTRETVLFGHRDGSILKRWPVPLPALVMVGCRTRSDPVDTLAHTARCPDHPDRVLVQYARLADVFGIAMRTRDADLVAHVATRSAVLNQARLPHDALESLLEVCRAVGGAGVQVAHSGSVASVLFNGSLPVQQLRPRVTDCRAALRSLGLEVTLTARTGRHRTRASRTPRSEGAQRS